MPLETQVEDYIVHVPWKGRRTLPCWVRIHSHDSRHAVICTQMEQATAAGAKNLITFSVQDIATFVQKEYLGGKNCLWIENYPLEVSPLKRPYFAAVRFVRDDNDEIKTFKRSSLSTEERVRELVEEHLNATSTAPVPRAPELTPTEKAQELEEVNETWSEEDLRSLDDIFAGMETAAEDEMVPEEHMWFDPEPADVPFIDEAYPEAPLPPEATL